MKALTVTVLLNIASLVASKPSKGEVKIGCDILKGEYPSSVFFPGEARYDFENEYGWSTTSWLGPACIFTPETPEQVSFAITTFSENNIKFAVRSGGAMPIDNAANIGTEGVLIANTNFTSISMSEDNSIVTVATGIRWPQLYAYLDDYNVTVNGIRMGNVGVVGYFLGGGIGFFSYEHGTGSVSVESFEVVLADGSIAEASLTQNEDLFWALRGGGNNFAIVTSVKIRTLNVPTIYASPVSYGSGAEVQQRYIQSLVEFAEYADADPKASMEGQIRWVPSRSPDIFFDAFLFHSEDSSPSPLGLQNFTAPVFPTTSGNLTQTTMGTWANQFPYDTDVGNRKLFHFFSIPANARAMEICLDEYYKAVAHLAEREGFFTAFSIMPITRRVIEKSTENGGNPVGLDADSAPALWLVESPSWLNAADDADVYAAHDAANAAIDSALAAEGFDQLRFIYLSDASKSQIEEVFPSYGPANVDRLQQIRNQYDPESVFTDLLVGGAKVARA